MDIIAIQRELDKIVVAVGTINSLMNNSGTLPPVPPITIPSSGNPYTDTQLRMPINPDDHLEFLGNAAYLQGRFWHFLWDVADNLHVRLQIVNACLLEGVPIENPFHYSDGRTVDIRYLGSDADSLALVELLIGHYVMVRMTYNEEITNDFEVRVDPKIKERWRNLVTGWSSRMKTLFNERVQGDPEGNHDNHMHVKLPEMEI